VVRAYLEPFDAHLSSAMHTLRSMSAAREPVSIRMRLSSVCVPIRLLVGDKRSDSAPTAEQIQLLLQSAPSVTIDTIAHTGSMIHEERPAAVVAAVRAMLDHSPVRDETADSSNGMTTSTKPSLLRADPVSRRALSIAAGG
jgi:pimeloyl-ACP methyl ester carboxylesterase